MGLLKTILGFFTNGGIAAIGKELNRAYENKLNAQNEQERIDADKEIARLQAHQSVLIAEQGSWMTRWIRPAFALPFVIYNFKIVVWDKVLGWGVTDPLSTELIYLQGIVFTAYFLTRPIEKIRKR